MKAKDKAQSMRDHTLMEQRQACNREGNNMRHISDKTRGHRSRPHKKTKEKVRVKSAKHEWKGKN